MFKDIRLVKLVTLMLKRIVVEKEPHIYIHTYIKAI